MRGQLALLVFENRVAIAAQPLVAAAMRALTSLTDGTAADPAAAVREVGRRLERALDVGPARPTARAPMATTAVPSPEFAPAVPAGEPETGPEVLPEGAGLDRLADLLGERRECLDRREVALVALRQAPDDVEAQNTVLRAFHTIEGTSAFLGVTSVSGFAHAAESLLARVRDGAAPSEAPCSRCGRSTP